MKIILTDDFVNISHFNKNDTHSYINNLLMNDNVYILKNSQTSIKKNYYILKYLKHFGLSSKKIITSKKISRNDFLIHFWFNDNYNFKLISNIKCKKIFHLMDYWLNSKYKREILNQLDVQLIISYASSDKYDQFFKITYSNYIGKVINLPFGFSERFLQNSKAKIINKNCLLLGSVNPIIEIDFFDLKNKEFYEYALLNDLIWFHPMRRSLSLQNQLDFCKSHLPKFPQIKNFNYNLVNEFLSYNFFYCCESILNFPAAKIFEGMACGCIPIIPKISIYTDLGFNDMQNCIFFEKNNVETLIKKIRELQNLDTNLINELSDNTKNFCLKNFTHDLISKKLTNFLQKLN